MDLFGFRLGSSPLVVSMPHTGRGKLPDLNLGTADGKSCAPGIGEALARRYGNPASGVHAVQLELSEATYMGEGPPYALREKLARKLRPQLRTLLELFLLAGAESCNERRRTDTPAADG